MEAQTFHLPVEPTAKGRPRVVRLKNGASHTFTPDKTVDCEERIRWHLRANGAVLYPVGVPLDVTMVFHCARPKSLPKKVTHHTKKPDTDQFVKLTLDACNAILFSDDSQVTTLRARKVYTTDEPYIYLSVTEAGDIV
jgi:Holliday junction resolvase RusA-like endonuclease